MQELNTTGRYQVDDETFAKRKEAFCGAYCDDETTKATIQEVFEGAGYLCDTHTAVAVNAYQQYVAKTGDKVTPNCCGVHCQPL